MISFAGIITYNPDIERLKENIDTLLMQFNKVLIVDNCSYSISSIEENFNDVRIEILKNNYNKGVAYGLNQILDYGFKNNYEWVLTLDQDSVSNELLLNNYEKYLKKYKDGAIFSCYIKDRNFKDNKNDTIIDNDVKEIDWCITAGSFCNIRALKEIGGFDNNLFIDFVDEDICYNLRNHGYKIYKIPFIGLLHEVGKGHKVKFPFASFYLYNHNPMRTYYMGRNSIIVAKKYPNDLKLIIIITKQILYIIATFFTEKNSFKKNIARIRGILSGIRYKR